MAILLWLVTLFSTLVTPACSVSQPFPQRATYALEPGHPEKSPAPATAPAPFLTIRIIPMHVARPFDSQLFVSKVGPEQFSQDYYNGFIAPPDRLLTAGLAEWLNESGAVRYAVPAASTLECAQTLESQLTALYADRSAKTAVLELRVFLIANAPESTPVLLQKVYRETQPLPNPSPDTLAAAWSAAWRRLLTRLSADLQALPAPQHRAARAAGVNPSIRIE